MTFARLSRSALSAAALASALAFGTACNSSGRQVMLSGAGSTFIYPLMGRWIEDFQQSHADIRVNYQSIGSGGGIQQVRSGTVDFGASDVALTDRELSQIAPVIQIPESAGPVCVTYNLQGLSKPLQLSAEVLAGIFLGRITNWKDPAFEGDNPGVLLPDSRIVVIHRADGSGTTNAFTTYLAAVNGEWSQKVGKGKSVSWPVGLGAKGSEGITGLVKQAPGSIGYVELTFAAQNQLPVAAIKNRAGNYVLPGAASTTAAIDAFQAQLANDPRASIVDPPASAAGAYPIATLTYLMIPKDGSNPQKRTALKQFLTYIVTEGQSSASALGYAPLPGAVEQRDAQALMQMTMNGKAVP